MNRYRSKFTMMLILGLLFGSPLFSWSKSLTLSVDERNWYPFTFIEKMTAKGMHVDIVKQALANLGYDFKILPFPKRRSINNVIEGIADGMISIAYHKSLATQIQYPDDAATNQESRFRIMQVDQLVINYIDSKYEFEGDIHSLPTPIRVPAGESIVDVLRKDSLIFEETRTDEQNFKKLIRDKKGTVLTTSIVAENMNLDPEFKGKFIIQPEPLTSQSYFLAFSKKSPLSLAEREKIWHEIERLRNDYVYMLQIFAQY